MTRFLLLFFCAILTSGCSISSPPSPAIPLESEQQLLLQVVEEIAGAQAPTSLQKLENLYPQSLVTERARALAGAFAHLQQQIDHLQKDTSRCRLDKERLARDFRQLQEDQEKLRKLVIEMEKHRR